MKDLSFIIFCIAITCLSGFVSCKNNDGVTNIMTKVNKITKDELRGSWKLVSIDDKPVKERFEILLLPYGSVIEGDFGGESGGWKVDEENMVLSIGKKDKLKILSYNKDSITFDYIPYHPKGKKYKFIRFEKQFP